MGQWSFNLKMSILGRLFILLLVIDVLITGCQKVEKQYIVVTKEKESTEEDSNDSGQDSEPVSSDQEEEDKVAPQSTEENASEPVVSPPSVMASEPRSVSQGSELYLPSDQNQLGDHWDRQLTQVFHENHRSIFRGTVATEAGLVSSNFSVLKILSDDEVLMLGAVHAFQNCSEEGIVLKSKERDVFGYCLDVYSIVPETDAVIFKMKFFESDIVKNLIPIVFAKSTRKGERLKFYTMGQDSLIPGYYPLYADLSKDCLLLSSAEKQIADPDTLNPIAGARFWSFSVSCDVIHGDSGGIVVNRANEFVGMLWTGAFPKNMSWTSQNIVQLSRSTMDESEKPEIWTEFNYVIPAIRIEEHLNMIVDSLGN